MPSVRRQRPAPRRGAVLIWLVLCLGVIIAIVALGTDGGRMMEERRRAQAAADAAVLAAAADLYQNYFPNRGLDPNGTAVQAALANAASNGYSNDGTTSTVTVNVPPTTGPFAGQAEYVEVLIQSHQQGSFSAAFTSGDLAVKARAVACGRPLAVGLILLQGSGAGALTVSGNAAVQSPTGSIVVNSPDGSAVITSGNGTISGKSVEVVGGFSGGGIACPVHTGVDADPDPLRTFPTPGPGSLSVQSRQALSLGGNGAVILQPGVYQGGLSISGNAAVTLMPGVYILVGGGLSLSGNASLTGTGVMIYNTGGTIRGGGDDEDDGGGTRTVSAGPIQLSGYGSVTLTAPTTGLYKGVTLFQDRNSTQPVVLKGNGSMSITGVVYAASSAVQLSGNGGSGDNTLGGAYVCSTLQVNGNGSFKVDLGANRPQVPDIHLAE